MFGRSWDAMKKEPRSQESATLDKSNIDKDFLSLPVALKPLPVALRSPPDYRDVQAEVAELEGSPFPNPVEMSGSVAPVTFQFVSDQIEMVIRPLQPFPEKRARLLTAKLVSIQSSISTWARDRDIVSIAQLESMSAGLPTNTQSALLQICLRLKDWVSSTERAELNRKVIASNFDQSRTGYLELMVQGYDSLETLRTLFSGLETIVPFLSNRLPHGIENQPSGLLATNVMPVGNMGRSDVQHQDISSAKSGSSLPTTTQPIRFLYLNCLQALRVIATQMQDKEPPNLMYSRLVIWGCGLFQSSTSLDLILETPDSESTSIFRDHIIGVLADITVLLSTKLPFIDDES